MGVGPKTLLVDTDTMAASRRLIVFPFRWVRGTLPIPGDVVELATRGAVDLWPRRRTVSAGRPRHGDLRGRAARLVPRPRHRAEVLPRAWAGWTTRRPRRRCRQHGTRGNLEYISTDRAQKVGRVHHYKLGQTVRNRVLGRAIKQVNREARKQTYSRWGRHETGPLSLAFEDMDELQLSRALAVEARLDGAYVEATAATDPERFGTIDLSGFDHLFDNEDSEDQPVREMIAKEHAEKGRASGRPDWHA